MLTCQTEQLTGGPEVGRTIAVWSSVFSWCDDWGRPGGSRRTSFGISSFRFVFSLLFFIALLELFSISGVIFSSGRDVWWVTLCRGHEVCDQTTGFGRRVTLCLLLQRPTWTDWSQIKLKLHNKITSNLNDTKELLLSLSLTTKMKVTHAVHQRLCLLIQENERNFYKPLTGCFVQLDRWPLLAWNRAH